MKRDPELVREILLATEKLPFSRYPSALDLPGYEQEDINYHIMLLEEADFVLAEMRGPGWVVSRLTWEGHEFLDAIRTDAGWKKAQEVMSNAGGFAFEVAKALVIEYLKREGLRLMGAGP